MVEININQIVRQMLDAASNVLENHWEEAKPFAEKEFKGFAENLQLVNNLKQQGNITEEQAKYYLDIQKSSIRIVLLTIEGLGILAVEAAINAALDVIRTTANTAIGWSIL